MLDYNIKLDEINKEIIKLFDINELNRLQRCAKNKDKKEIIKWGKSFEDLLNNKYNIIYQEYYINELKEKLKDIDIAIMYVLHFCESTKFGNNRLTKIMTDLGITLKGFYKDGFTREDYQIMLANDGIKIGVDKLDDKNK